MDEFSGHQISSIDVTTRPKTYLLLSLASKKIAWILLPRLMSNSRLKLRIICDDDQARVVRKIESTTGEKLWIEDRSSVFPDGKNSVAVQAENYRKWADIFFVVADASTISSMLAGLVHDITLATLRCWDISKRVILLPELSLGQWTNPITEKQLSEIRLKWPWVRLLNPALWHIHPRAELTPNSEAPYKWDWHGPAEAAQALESEISSTVQTQRLQQATDSIASAEFSREPHLNEGTRDQSQANEDCSASTLPHEIWTMIFEFLGDWEYATALGVYTTLPIPSEWQHHFASCSERQQSLEYKLLTAPYSTIYEALETYSSAPCALRPLAVKIIFKFSLTAVLSHLVAYQKDLFWTSFGPPQIPHQASTKYNNPTILEWWRNEPAILKKEYGSDAIDGASRAGFVAVLDWWASSGLELRYTDKALESASARGHIEVLDWWKRMSIRNERTYGPGVSTADGADSAIRGSGRGGGKLNFQPVALKVGKSILSAAQAGQTDALRWWHHSGIPYAHEESVARIASTHGHVDVLETWRDLTGNKMIFDNQVLVGATKNGHVDVLEWWKSRSRGGTTGGSSGGGGGGSTTAPGATASSTTGELRVEYKTCDIEEAMEDCLCGSRRQREVREWWEQNGLNLGLTTDEWMRVRTLGE